MIVGILSDTHGQVRRTAAAVRLLRRLDATALLHCGDIGSPAILEELAGLPAWAVCGNTDVLDGACEQYAAALGVRLARQGPARIALGGRTLALCHGHESGFHGLLAAAEAGRPAPDGARYDYVLHGHTHVAGVWAVGALRVINPGALHRAAVHTVATLDLARDDVRFWRVPDGSAADDTPPTPYHPGA